MPGQTEPPESDLWVPLPKEGEHWNYHTIHTHYFNFFIPEESISANIYIRYMPVFRSIQGGVIIFKGMDNMRPLDSEHCNYVMTMPWPLTVDGSLKDGVAETANGLRIEFVQPGAKVRVQYHSKDGTTSFDVLQTAITPLLTRGHVMPAEDINTDPSQRPGGSEQFMHCTGNLTLNGTPYKVDCHSVRDRSWRQVRTEDEVIYPPVVWSPISFGENLSLNQIGYESSPQLWKRVIKYDPAKQIHHFAWLVVNGAIRNVIKVKRDVQHKHPELFAAVEQTLELEDDQGNVYKFQGKAVAMAQLPAWPNITFIDSLFRWTDEKGRVAYAVNQETYHHTFNRFCRGKA